MCTVSLVFSPSCYLFVCVWCQSQSCGFSLSAVSPWPEPPSPPLSLKMPPFRAVVEQSEAEIRSYGNVALLPLRQTTKGSDRGPAPPIKGEDIVDQSLNLFKVRNRSSKFLIQNKSIEILFARLLSISIPLKSAPTFYKVLLLFLMRYLIPYSPQTSAQ